MSPPYERLAAWRFCHELALRSREFTKGWSKEDSWLGSQIRRAAFSAAANMVEGSTKRGPREFRRYLDISLGSLAELEYAFRFACDAKIESDLPWDDIRTLRNRAHGTTRLLYNTISDKVRQGEAK
ncbi:MAG TPA: four helix bundle protein [Gemmatimonadales bacterium]|jgi:four helix bundle protein|nr:four helix bundle protein [Gemmatimonadales bacterium]